MQEGLKSEVMVWKICLIVLIIMGVAGGWVWWQRQPLRLASPLVDKILEKPLDKYTIDNLGKRKYQSQIVLDEAVATASAYTVYNFHFDSDGKKITGLAHIPNSCKKCPVIAQFRGYVEREIYKPGVGTKRTAEMFAKNGFVSLAPDGLGYGESDNPSPDVFEERFQTYTTALNLLSAIGNWSLTDPDKVGIWGHSNGGQIALTVLEISGKEYPTVLWAPVSKPFPYSILYYTDEAEDRGKALRKKLAEFERDYDVELYSLTNYLDSIKAPIQIHQGTLDESVPKKWTDELVKQLKADYLIYSGVDHNLVGGWSQAVQRSIDFWEKHW